MKLWRALLFGTVLVMNAQALMGAEVSITVKAKGSGDPVSGAIVVAARGSFAEADAQGRASLTGVNIPSKIKVLAPGYETAYIEIEEASARTVYLIPHAYETEGLEVVEERVPEKASKVVFSAEELHRAPGSGGDAVKVIQSLPGVVTAAEGTGLMYMRGSDTWDNSYWVNGVPIWYLYHMGGIQSTINPSLVEDFNVFLGGFPVEYGDNLGGAVDVRVRPPKDDRLHQTYNIGTYQSSLLVEGPVGDSGKDSFYVSARRSYIDLLVSPDEWNKSHDDNGDEPSNEILSMPKFYDAQAEWRHNLDRGTVEFHYFAAGDEMAILNNEDARTDPQLAGDAEMKMSYQTAGVNWHEQGNDGWSHQVVLSLGESSQRYSMGTDPDGNPFYAKVGSRYARLQPELYWRSASDERYSFGIESAYQSFPLDLYMAEPCAPDVVDCDYTSTPKHRVNRTLEASLVAPFAKYSRTWGDLTGSFGVRYSTFRGSGGIGDEAFSPRGSLEYALNEKTLLTAAWGRYVQIPNGVYLVDELGNPSLVYTKAEHRIVGVKYQLDPRWALQVEGYQKPMTDLVVGTGEAPPDNYANQGTGEAHGADILVKRQGGDGKMGWLSYSYSRSHRTNKLTGERYVFEGDQPHTLILVWSQPLTGSWSQWNWGVRVEAHSGRPYTPVVDRYQETLADGTTRFRPVYGKPYSERLPAYYRVDMRFDRRVLFNSSKLNFYFDLQNVTFHKNVVGYDYGSELQHVDDPREVKGMSFMPFFGVETTF